MSNSVRLHRQQPTRLLCPWDSPCTHVYLRTYSCLENPVDRGAWWTAVHGVAKSRTRPSDLTSTFHFHALEKATVTHSSILAWRIPGTGEPGGLLSMISHKVGHDCSNLAAAAANILERLPTTGHGRGKCADIRGVKSFLEIKWSNKKQSKEGNTPQ